jgi:predicted kinase
MKNPLLIIVNGLPASGKTTLSARLAHDLSLPVFARDGIFETLFDALACDANGQPPLLGAASFSLLYAIAGSILAAGQSVIVEGFFGRPDLRTAEFINLQQRHDFEPFQILCKADGEVLVQRIIARAGSGQRHTAHPDLQHLEQNRERLLRGDLSPLALDGQLVEIDTTTPDRFDYAGLLHQIRDVLLKNV